MCACNVVTAEEGNAKKPDFCHMIDSRRMHVCICTHDTSEMHSHDYCKCTTYLSILNILMDLTY